ncbi:DUF3857 domain-containing transglutaminase family protein [Pseudomonas aeruginosa]|nr:DUF3857 domain-containing transglutaminase family protein [Pseudomonas aeruginosa]
MPPASSAPPPRPSPRCNRSPRAPLAGETEFRCQFNADNSTDCVSTYSFTILKPSGREMLSRIDRSYAETDSLIVEKAELTQPGGKPVPLDQSQIDTRTAPNPDQGFLRERQTSLAFPNLRVGTRISYTPARALHRQAAEHPVPLHSQPPADAGARRPLLAEFKAERPIFVRSELMDAYRIEQSADKKTLKVSLKKPQYTNYINEAGNAYLRHTPRLELGSSLDLQDNFGPFAARYNEILAAELPKGAAAAVAAVKGKPAREQVAGLMQYINDTYRYLGDWRASERGYVPFSLAEIERNGYGDCKDLAILLAAMLKAAGIKAEPTLVSRGDVVWDLLVPGMYAPNHCHRPRRGGRQDLVAGPDQPGVRSRPHHARHPAALGAGAGRRRQGAARRDSPGSARRHPARDPQRALHP